MDYRALLDGSRRGVFATLARTGLRVASLPYRIAVNTRNQLYDRQWLSIHRATVPVIAIGNLTVGGTGKTPLVAAIAARLRGRGVRVALISRGYRSDESGTNDEARELFDRLPDVPHLQNPDRVAAAEIAINELEMQVIVLDDAFQHRRMGRDLDIVLIDATCPFGYGHLLPAGLLREPKKSLRRAQVVLLTRADRISAKEREQLIQQLKQLAPQATLAECRHVPRCLIDHRGRTQELHRWKEFPVAAFAGIGNPQPFFQSLTELGMEVVGTKGLPDHCGYGRSEVETLTTWLKGLREKHPKLVAVCTHKDLVKLRVAKLAEVPLQALQIELEITAGQDRFWKPIDDLADQALANIDF